MNGADKVSELASPEHRKRAEKSRSAKKEERRMARKIREMDFFEDEDLFYEEAAE